MKIVARFITFFNNFFRICAEYSRPAWEFRIRFSIEKRHWLIELHENGDQQWKPLTRLDESTEHELHVLKFDSYQAAAGYVAETGLHMAYEQAHYTHDKKPLSSAANAIDRHLLEVAQDTMGSKFPSITAKVVSPLRRTLPGSQR